MRSECDESCRLFSLVSAQYLLYCTLEIVIPTKSEYSPEIGKGSLVPLQKCLLTGVRKAAMEGPSTGHAAHAEHINLLSFSFIIAGTSEQATRRFLPHNVALREDC